MSATCVMRAARPLSNGLRRGYGGAYSRWRGCGRGNGPVRGQAHKNEPESAARSNRLARIHQRA
jgi:hypothetical protein